MDGKLKEMKQGYFIISAIFIIFGMVLTIWPLEITTILCYMLGSVILFYGLSRIYMYFSTAEQDRGYHMNLIIGLIVSSIGLFIFFKSESIISLLPIIIGLTFVVESFTKLQHALELRSVGHPRWNIVLVLAGINLLIAIILLYNPFTAASLMIRVIGISLLYNGVSELWVLLCISRYIKQENIYVNNNTSSQEVVDVDVIEHEIKE